MGPALGKTWWLALVLGLAACTLGCDKHPSATAFEPKGYTLLDQPTLPFVFAYPKGWKTWQESGGTLIADPRPTASDYPFMFSVQALAPEGMPSQALRKAYESVQDLDGFDLEILEFRWVDGVLALVYEVQFEWHETLRHKHGLLLLHPWAWYDIALGSDANLCVQGFPSFEQMLSTLEVF